jgi:hypothetical protein
MGAEALGAKHASVWQSAPKVATIVPVFGRRWIKLILDAEPRQHYLVRPMPKHLASKGTHSPPPDDARRS